MKVLLSDVDGNDRIAHRDDAEFAEFMGEYAPVLVRVTVLAGALGEGGSGRLHVIDSDVHGPMNRQASHNRLWRRCVSPF